MNKWLLYGCATLGSIIGSYVPALWHAGFLSMWGMVGGLVGAIVGIWVAFRINNYVDF